MAPLNYAIKSDENTTPLGKGINFSEIFKLPSKVTAYKVRSFYDAVCPVKDEIDECLLGGGMTPSLGEVVKILKDSKLEYEFKAINKVKAVLAKNRKIPFDSNKIDGFLEKLEVIKKIAKQQADTLSNVSSTLSAYGNNPKSLIQTPANEANDQLKKVIISLYAFSDSSSSLNGLYEIQYSEKGVLRLIKVPL